jgi:hypothetical protein
MKKIVFIFGAAVFLITLGFTQSTAFERPPNPVMNYVPQNIGIYDTYYDNFKESDCRVCHGDRNAEAIRHQYAGSAFAACPDGCPPSPPDCLTACHSDPSNPQSITDDCKECHIFGGIMGDLGFPHHMSDLAGSGQCTACHQPDLLVGTYSVRTPYFYPTPNTHTPTPFHCENCHWPSVNGNAPHQPPLLSDWNSWTGLPKPTTWPDSLPHPAPIEANGLVINYNLHPSKPYRPMDGTHHEINGYAYSNCFQCHANDPGPFHSDLDNPLLIRFCENCHSRDSLHSIQEHVTAGNGLTVQEKCIACHGGMPDVVPPSGAKFPAITGISPLHGSQGTSCTITGKNFYITGSTQNILLTPKMGATDQTYRIPSGSCSRWRDDSIIFTLPSGLDARNYTVRVETVNGTSNVRVFTLTGSKPCIPCPAQTPVINSIEPPVGTDNAIVIVHGQNFGDRHTGDRDVLLLGDYGTIPAPIISWTGNEIQFRLPPWEFFPGTIPVKVRTEIGESNQIDFLLRDYPSLNSLQHMDTVSIRLTATGGFGDTQESLRPDGYGWKSAVTFNRPDEMITVAPGNVTSWSDTEIQLTLPALKTDSYGVAFVTRYFYDSDGNGGYTLGVDKVYQTVTSDPQLFRPIECSLVPDTTSIQQGGILGFQGTVINYTDKSTTVLFATKVTLPNGNKYPSSDYLIGPLSIFLDPYQSKSGHRSLDIPTTAPLGNYTYHGYVGNYGVGIYHECTFGFTVTAAQ